MIWGTGDFHSYPFRLSTEQFPEQKAWTEPTKNTVIQLGDFGCVFMREENKDEKYKLDWLASKPFTTVFVDGNHENHPRLAQYPEAEWCGGKVNVIRPNVLHLKRGEIYTIEGKTFFVFGGAVSHDTQDGILDYEDEDWRKRARWLDKHEKTSYRVKGLDWWPEELPSKEEMLHGLANLQKVDNKVDFILTHCPPLSTLEILKRAEVNPLTLFLETLNQSVTFEHWFSGHVHQTVTVDDKHTVLYEDVIRIV